MKKILVIGCPGSGKSTFARALHAKTAIPLYHLDLLYWNGDKTHISTGELLAKLRPIMKNDSWILDGNYKSSLEYRLKFCDTVFFLDYSLETCLHSVYSRIGAPRPDMPWIETEQDASELAAYVRTFFETDRKTILDLLQQESSIEKVVFDSRSSAERYLNSLQHK